MIRKKLFLLLVMCITYLMWFYHPLVASRVYNKMYVWFHILLFIISHDEHIFWCFMLYKTFHSFVHKIFQNFFSLLEKGKLWKILFYFRRDGWGGTKKWTKWINFQMNGYGIHETNEWFISYNFFKATVIKPKTYFYCWNDINSDSGQFFVNIFHI